MIYNNISKDIEYKGLKFNIEICPKQEFNITCYRYPIELSGTYYLDGSIMDAVYKALDNAKIDEFKEKFEDFIRKN